MTNSSGQLVWNTYPKPFGDISEKTSVDPISGRTVVTNLRLPGQYDERLLGSVGLQGPYYNWNRWYLPGVGRYLELDPVALDGLSNGEYVPEWYTYAGGNPLRYFDSTGLDRYLPCQNPDWGPIQKKVCRKVVNWACKKGVMGAQICCEADRETCYESAGDDTAKQAACDVTAPICKSMGGKDDLKPPGGEMPKRNCEEN